MNFKGYLLLIIIPSFMAIAFTEHVIAGIVTYGFLAIWGLIGYQDEFGDNSKKNIKQINPVKTKIDPVLRIKEKDPFLEEKKIIKEYAEFFKNNFNPPLTDNQKIAVVTDNGNNLIISGAGTGKTTTIIAKILFLLESKKAKQEEMLVVVFTNSAGDELRKRLTKEIGENKITISTLHAFAKSIIHYVEKIKPHVASFLDTRKAQLAHIEQIIKNLCKKSKSFKKNFADFFIYEKIENLEGTFKTKEEYLNYLNTVPKITMNGESVKSKGELDIANFFYKYKILYKYEDTYMPKTEFSHKPDFHIENTNIWIEYVGIDKYGRTRKDISNKKYKDTMEWKRNTHKENNTDLVEIHYADFQNRDWEKKLKDKLLDLDVNLKERSDEEIIANIKKIEFTKYAKLVNRFLDLDKARTERNSPTSLRQEKFLKLYEEIRKKYEESLGSNLDFNDMINKSCDYLKNNKYRHIFSYVIVDEFQDISISDCNFIKELLSKKQNTISEMNDQKETKLYCVGDDWQSIYGFRGADPSIMVNFDSHFDKRVSSKPPISLDTTFRFDNIVNDISSRFLMKNSNQIKKNLKSYHKTNKSSVLLHRIEPKTIMESIEEWVMQYSSNKDYQGKNLLILDRYNRYQDDKEKEKEFKEFLEKVRGIWGDGRKVNYKTLHSSKGKQEDLILIVGIKSSSPEDRKSFPSEFKDDEVLNIVRDIHDNYSFSDERRLLYVGMTRAKFHLHLLCDYINESPFTSELKEDKQIKVVEAQSLRNRICPHCKEGSIRNVQRNKNTEPYYLCNRQPICKFSGFNCQIKDCKGLVVRKKDKGVCEICNFEYIACGFCDSGILRNYTNASKENFLGCHTFPFLNCKYTQSI